MPFRNNTLEQLFRDHYRALCIYAIHHVDDIDTAEDVVMDCFERFAQKCSGNTEIQSAKGYLYRMVHHACADVHRSAIHEVPDTVLTDIPDDADQLVERSEREARLWGEIDRLPTVCRQVFLMNKRDGMRQKDIAQTLGISVKTVEAHIAKAYERLRQKAHDIYLMLFF